MSIAGLPSVVIETTGFGSIAHSSHLNNQVDVLSSCTGLKGSNALQVLTDHFPVFVEESYIN